MRRKTFGEVLDVIEICNGSATMLGLILVRLHVGPYIPRK
jgi:hypothetical protein